MKKKILIAILAALISAVGVVGIVVFTHNGNCTVWNSDIEDTEGVTFMLSSDETYYSVTGYTGTATRVRIAESYNGLPVKSIADGAFSNNYEITEVIIPSSVTSIGDYAFEYCASLTSVTIPNSVTSIGEGAFAWCSSLTSITIPDSVTSIGDEAFAWCSSLTSVTIPGSVTSIDSGAFYGCYKLVEVINKSDLDIIKGNSSNGYVAYYALNVKTKGSSDIVNVNDYLFYTYDGTNYLLGYTGNGTALVLPDKYKGQNYEIYHYAFFGCSELTSVTIGNGVTSIGRDAFNGCSSLTSVTIPDSVTSIGDYAFYGCDKLNVEDNGVYYVDNWVVDADRSITSAIIKDGIRGIADYAFYYCESLTTVTIPDGVTSIGEMVFYGCEKLFEVINKSNLTITKGSEDNGYVAYYALNVKTKGASDIVNVDGYLFYTHDGTNYLLGYIGSQTDLVLPDKYNGQNYEIYECAFYDCSKLTSVTIGSGVTSIGEEAFEDCEWLKSVNYTGTIDQWAQIYFSGYSSNPLYYVKKLYINNELVTEVNLTTATKISAYAFFNCSSLTSVTIPNSVTSIGDGAFSGCSSLTSVTIGSGVTSISYGAFYGCESLTSVTIPYGVTSIGDWAFEGCSSLTSVTIPDSVTSIGDYAFYGCSSLTSVTIGSGVTSIGESAFERCSKLTSVYYKGTETGWNNMLIDNYGNSYLTSATRYYYSESNPFEGESAVTGGNYWHYDTDGKTPVVWTKD